MRKHWYTFLFLSIFIFQIVITQPFAYAKLVSVNIVDAANTAPNSCIFAIADVAVVIYSIASIILLFLFITWCREEDYLIKYKNEWTVGLGVLLAIVSSCGFQFLCKDFSLKDYLGFIFPICIGILGGFYGSLQVTETAKIKKALEYIDKWDSSELQPHRSNIITPTNLIKEINDYQNTEDALAIITTAIKGDNQIKANPQIEFDLRFICNFWEKIYILLSRNQVDKTILKEAFCKLYKDKYSKVCNTFLVYLEEGSISQLTITGEIKKHLDELIRESIWGK
jgi:hypothetical protein